MYEFVTFGTKPFGNFLGFCRDTHAYMMMIPFPAAGTHNHFLGKLEEAGIRQ